MTLELISALATTPIVANETVHVLGYYTIGDGGGGDFYWDANSVEEEDLGTIFISGNVATGRWKRLYNSPLSALWFGAKGDGTTNDTSKLQKAIKTAEDRILDGEGRTYLVASPLSVQSNTTVRNFRFQHAGSSIDFTSVLTVDGMATEKQNILFENIYINGNRDNHMNIDSAAEDGGRHGIRCLGSCKHLTFRNVEVEYCAADGLEFFSNQQVDPGTETYLFEYIKIEDSRFSWNRRHGISGDCMKGVELKNVELSFNGLDTPAAGAQPANHGSKGDRATDGKLYGNGVDWEGYSNGTNITDLLMDNVRAFKNALCGIQFWDKSKTAANETNWRTWERIRIVNSYSDYGQFSTPSFGTGTLYKSAIRLIGAQLYGTFRDIVIENNFLEGNILLQSCDKVSFNNNNVNFIYPVGKDERPNQLLYCRDVFIRDLHYSSDVEPMLFYANNSTGIVYENSKNNIEWAGRYLDVIPSFVQDLRVHRIGNTLKFYMKLGNAAVASGDTILKFKWWSKNNQPFKVINFYRVDSFAQAFNAVLKGSESGDALTALAAYNFVGNAVFCEFETAVFADVF
ncbi:glycosyl hydrolase family 28-related protein [Chitinophaga sp. S165]|uniref:glycosyl hydrolase family 28-related protein n=1 Tax=Chitinophaga sp. S165 TaxID=2135462 RepID=UPI000D70BEDF|nr:glycosyl hydrolase family 28-related protein [Chitinophaga sp. S165]PWV56154.1 pectate lyase-like protein [Chitinophaga sp. S165]